MKFKFQYELLAHVNDCDPEKIKNGEFAISSPKKQTNFRDESILLLYKCDVCDMNCKNDYDLKKHKAALGHEKAQGSVH